MGFCQAQPQFQMSPANAELGTAPPQLVKRCSESKQDNRELKRKVEDDTAQQNLFSNIVCLPILKDSVECVLMFD